MNQSRRVFIKNSAGALAAASLASAVPTSVFAAGSDRLRVGIVGCGGRGRGAARNIVEADPAACIVALGDAFIDRAEEAWRDLREGNPDERRPREPLPSAQFDVSREHVFSGFDAYRKVLDVGLDIVILTAPPYFRPEHLRAAVEKGVHVFAEKPVAVDPMGIRAVIATGERARAKGLAIVAGTQRRHHAAYLETIKRIKDGAIGEVVGGQAYWMQEGLWHRGRRPEWSDMEYQMRNWLYFTWLSGDHIVEQHMHNLDVMNWIFGGPPVRALGMGGRQSRTSPEYGNIFDHFSVEFEYANGARVQSFCRQAPGCTRRVAERLVGTRGWSDPSGTIEGSSGWKFEKEMVDPYVQEHINLIKSIRAGRPINEARQVAESTLTAILGRMSAYTGREVSYDWVLNRSALDLSPPALDWVAYDVPPPAVPGIEALV